MRKPLQIKNFTIDGKYKSVKSRGENVLILGDSIGPQIASLAYANALFRELNYNILAQGIGGYRYEPDEVIAVDGFAPDKIIVALGTNSCNDDLYDYERSVIEFYKRLSEVFPKIPLLSVHLFGEGTLLLVH